MLRVVNKTRHQTQRSFARHHQQEEVLIGPYWLMITTAVLAVSAIIIAIIFWLKIYKKNRHSLSTRRFVRVSTRRRRRNHLHEGSRVDSVEVLSISDDERQDDAIVIPPMPSDRIILGKEIGEGHFGQVFRGHLMTSNGHREGAELVAVKVIRSEIRSEGMGLKAHDELMHEAEIMAARNCLVGIRSHQQMNAMVTR